MIRSNVEALGMLVDILEWDGNVEELRSFTPADQILGETDEGVMLTGSMKGIADGYKRYLRRGDLLVRPVGRVDISPLHFFGDTWWATALELVEKR